MRATVVIPTYNERDNILSLLDALRALSVPELRVLVVDDSSPDGTGSLVQTYGRQHPEVSLLSRPNKTGLGHAYLAAFRELLYESPARRPEAIVQMDADFSHDPRDVPRLLSALETADVAIGSRYVPGGGTRNWAWPRRLLSRSANVVAHTLLRLPVRDLTSGFCAWRATMLERIMPLALQSEGYGFQIELKLSASHLGGRLREVPIVFTERRAGQSKINRAIITEAFGIVLRRSLPRSLPKNVEN